MTYEEIQELIETNLPNGNKIKSVKHREVEHALLDYIQANISQSGDIKRVKCDLTYLTANFETDGLGRNLRLGWAICNGNNGTDNLAGRVGVGYGLGFSVLGQTGGAETHTLSLEQIPAHTHDTTFGGDDANDSGSSNTWLQSSGSLHTKTSTSKGGGQSHNNMQPYIINLYIMKL